MLDKIIENVKSSLGVKPKAKPTTIPGQVIAVMRVRAKQNGKKRPIFVNRPTLKEVQSRIDALNRQARKLRGSLRRTTSPQSQMDLNGWLEKVAVQKRSIMAYVKAIQTPLAA